MLLILCCSSNDYTLEKIESINPEQKSGHAAGCALPSAAVFLTTSREHRKVDSICLTCNFRICKYGRDYQVFQSQIVYFTSILRGHSFNIFLIMILHSIHLKSRY